MQSDTQAAPTSKKMIWTGRILSALPAILLIATGILPLVNPAAVEKGIVHLGYPASLGHAIGILELACAIVYVIPRTAVLGAILITAYLGGATASHVRIGEPPLMPIVVCMVAWLGIYLRDARLRALVPLRK